MPSLEKPDLVTTNVRYRMPSVHPEGRKFVVIAAAITLLFWFVIDWDWIGWIMAGITLWVAAFFRDPIRTTLRGEGLIIAPADGMVTMITSVPPPRELMGGEDGLLPDPVVRVSIFMSVFDVHINRTPVTGLVTRVGFTQIAGLVARRIVPWVKAGDRVGTGQRVGLIRFGSRVDVYLPAGTSSLVLLGQRTVAGETLIARIGQSEV